jgi:hypothetical protein
MPKAAPIELRIAAIAALPDADLPKSLKDKSNLIAAKTAEQISARNLSNYAPDLASAYHRFQSNDKGCHAKTAIIKSLYELGISNDDLYLKSIRHTQPEPVWGGSSDAAGQLRGYSALALVRTASKHAITESLRLLVDPDIQARTMGVRAVAYHASDTAMHLLRLKALAGDTEITILAETFTALLRAWPAKSADFIAEFLNNGAPDVRSAALSALAESRTDQAFTIFQDRYAQTIDPNTRCELLTAIAALRREPAIDFLLHILREESPGEAREALAAMESFKSDPAILARITAAVRDRDELRITEKYEEIFKEEKHG